MTRPGGRPRGDLRRMLAQVYAEAVEALTWRDAAARLVAGGQLPSVGASELRLIRRTVANMAHAGELQPAGQVRHAGCNRPMTAYRLPAAGAAATSVEPCVLLAQALRRDSTN